jgi:hypothetical protein
MFLIIMFSLFKFFKWWCGGGVFEEAKNNLPPDVHALLASFILPAKPCPFNSGVWYHFIYDGQWGWWQDGTNLYFYTDDRDWVTLFIMVNLIRSDIYHKPTPSVSKHTRKPMIIHGGL